MTARRSKGGRTTPKGTTNPKRTTRAKPTPPGGERSGWTSAPTKSDKSQQRSSRPQSHNRGNR